MPTGEQIYQQHCASCHGKEGEGVATEYADPLVGERSVASLAKYIDRWMPEDNPKLVTGDDAMRVARYMFDAFYSPAAQAKKNPQRVELSRLTEGQYRQSVADIFASFSQPVSWDAKRGLRGEYATATRRYRQDKRVIDRLDATVDFNFGQASPDEIIAKEEFAIRWTGSILVPDTGEYEFIVETENGTRLWVNDLDENKPLIDRWVRSGSEKKHREPLRLVGGRTYPLRLEMYKEKKETSASVMLKWKPPHGTEQVIATRLLSPVQVPKTFVITTAFPPDDRSMGYVRGNMISKAWDEATTYAALEVADHVVSNLTTLTGSKSSDAKDADRRDQAIQFCAHFVELAFRRPLANDERQFFIDRQFKNEADLDLAVKKTILLALKSPRFLYHETGKAKLDAYDIASRVSYGLWDSIPDAKLLEAAKAGRLATREGVVKEIDRMMPDLRTRAKMREFFHLWLGLDRLHDLGKNPKLFADFTPEVIADIRTSFDLLLEDVTWSEASDYRELFKMDSMYLNARLAKFYGVDLPAGSPEAAFQKVKLEHQAGLLTHPLLMAGFAYDAESSPIHRGVFVSRSLLGRRLRPPPDAVVPVPPDLHPDLTTRERIAMQTKGADCMTCHKMINPLGFTFENFDAAGRFRAMEKEKPIDTKGFYQTLDGETVTFTGPRDLATFLAGSDEAHAAVVERLFQHVVKQPLRAFGTDRGEKLRRLFVKNEFSLRALLRDTVVASVGVE